MNLFENTTPILKRALADMIAEQIHEGLSKQSFYDWYLEGKWDEYIRNMYDDPACKEEILKNIKELFNLK